MRIPIAADPDDDPVIYTAIAGQSDVICTVDKHFFEASVLSFCARNGIEVMTDVTLVRALRFAG